MCIFNCCDDNVMPIAHRTFMSRAISFVVSISNAMAFFPMMIAYNHGKFFDIVFTILAFTFSTLHHLTATNRKLVPMFLIDNKIESLLLQFDRICAGTLVVRGLMYAYDIHWSDNFHMSLESAITMTIVYVLGTIALICVLISDVMIKHAVTTRMRLTYGFFHSVWHVLAFVAWAGILDAHGHEFPLFKQ